MRKITLTAIIAGSAVAGIAAGATVATIAAPDPAPRTITITDTCAADYADMLLDAYSMTLDAWEAGTAYNESIRTDNLDAYELLLSQCD